jgi:hypothetical protein
LILWADRIFSLENRHKNSLESTGQMGRPVERAMEANLDVISKMADDALHMLQSPQ